MITCTSQSETKRCASCATVKRRSDFYAAKRTSDGLQSYCKDCARERSRSHQRVRHASDPELKRELHLKYKYGISIAEYDRLLLEQGGVCAICRCAETKSDHQNEGAVKRLAVDHDHDTGAVRGLLCDRCNRGIGLLRDDTSVLRAAVAYLDGAR